MQCPACKTVQLAMSHRENVEIDYCPQCRGVWLDRGELDKIIEQSQRDPVSTQAHMDPGISTGRGEHHGRREHGGGHQESGHGSSHGGSFLRRLFD